MTTDNSSSETVTNQNDDGLLFVGNERRPVSQTLSWCVADIRRVQGYVNPRHEAYSTLHNVIRALETLADELDE